MAPFELLVPAGLLLVAAGCDLRDRTIPDWVSVALALTGAALALWRAPEALGAHALLAAALFAGGAVAFAAGLFGGGDVKLIAALAFWTPPALAPSLLLWTALAGGALGAATFAFSLAAGLRRGAGLAPALTFARRAETPYACAIALGALTALGAEAA
jgi:prepilin peptidase CpaA